jgi:hypothetical protein
VLIDLDGCGDVPAGGVHSDGEPAGAGEQVDGDRP